jgi:hypothetical protein
MAVKTIQLFEEVDNEPKNNDYYDEYAQGTTWTNLHIFKVTSDDGTEQFFKQEIVHDSYGKIDNVPTEFTEVKPKTKKVTYFE